MLWKKLFSPVENMDSEEARAFLAQHRAGEYVLLDVRQPAEYDRAHIPGAKLIPLPELTDRLAELDPAKPTIAY